MISRQHPQQMNKQLQLPNKIVYIILGYIIPRLDNILSGEYFYMGY